MTDRDYNPLEENFDELAVDDGELFATDEELAQMHWEQLPFSARVAIEAVCCRAGNGDAFPHIRVDLLSTASRIATHYANGGLDHFHQLRRNTIGLRSGLQLVQGGVQIGKLKAGDVLPAVDPGS